MKKISKIFNQQGTFKAFDAMNQWARRNGFSLGSRQRGNPQGVIYGDASIAKWRNLSKDDQRAMHGQVTGDALTGPMTFTLFLDRAPAEAIATIEGEDA